MGRRIRAFSREFISDDLGPRPLPAAKNFRMKRGAPGAAAIAGLFPAKPAEGHPRREPVAYLLGRYVGTGSSHGAGERLAGGEGGQDGESPRIEPLVIELIFAAMYDQ